MSRKLTILTVFLVFIGSIIISVLFLTVNELYTFLGSFLLLGIICISFSGVLGFATLIAEVLGIGFFNVVIAWNKNWGISLQTNHIASQAIFSFGAVSVWLLIYSFKKDWEELQNLHIEVERLQKYEPATEILTLNEFVEKSKLLFMGMKRRQEKGFYLIFELKSEDASYKDRVRFDKLSEILLNTIRNNFDLIGRYSDNKLIVWLSNTDVTGVDVVMKRFQQSLVNESALTTNMIQNSINELPDSWNLFEDILNQSNRRVLA